MSSGLRALFATGLALMCMGPAAASIDFIVFFLGPNPEKLDPEQWRVTPEGANVIAEYAGLYREDGHGGYVLLSGHDQKFGSEHNALLRSQRRADAVRDLLVEHGLPASVVSTKACGWSRQIVVTGNDVEEPQNRYVFFWWARDEADLAEVTKNACLP